jgi:hypothetical protein
MSRTNILSGPHLALALSGDVPSGDRFNLAIELLAPENKTFSEFNYTRGQGVDYVSGPDNSALQSALRFSQTDDISVYINGVKLTPSAYDRTVNNRIKFNSKLVDEYNTIKVVVFSRPKLERRLLAFKKVYDFCGTDSAWQNVTTVERYDSGPMPTQYTVFYCDDFSGIRQNATFVVAADQSIENPSKVTPDNWFALLSKDPHTSYDRDVDYIIDIKKLIADKTQILFEIDSKGRISFTVADTALSTVFPRLRVFDRCRKDTGGDVVSDEAPSRKSPLIN